MGPMADVKDLLLLSSYTLFVAHVGRYIVLAERRFLEGSRILSIGIDIWQTQCDRISVDSFMSHACFVLTFVFFSLHATCYRHLANTVRTQFSRLF